MHFNLSLLLDKVPMKSGMKRFMRSLGKHYGDSHEQGEIWVRQQTLAEEENISRSTIWRNAKEAVEQGLIFVKKQFHRNKRQKCSSYQINWLKLYELAGEKHYSDKLPQSESEIVDLPTMEDIVDFVEKHDSITRDRLIEDTYSNHREVLYNNAPIVAKCSTSKENKLYIKNISQIKPKKWSDDELHRRRKEAEDFKTGITDPSIRAQAIADMRNSLHRRH